MRQVALAAIRAYQRYLSPYKGFCCAYRRHTGRGSCSALGYRAVSRYGVLGGLSLIRRRTQLCGVAYRRFQCHSLHRRGQRGACDIGCDLPCHGGCDSPSDCCLPGSQTKSELSRLLGFCDCNSCDWTSRKDRSSDKEKDVYIPPKTLSRTDPSSLSSSKDGA
jgi:putative component of membrane protein insertase Oxa1/YidC/SpoIIIJ protein YidD